MWEGLLNPWAEDAAEWLSCPAPIEAPQPVAASGLLSMWQTAYEGTTRAVQAFLRDGVEIRPDGPVVCPHYWAQPLHKLNCEIVWPKALDHPPFNVRFDSGDHDHDHAGDEEEDNTNLKGAALLELDTPEYSGVIEKQMLIEKLLAQGGIRLAGLLNYLFAEEGKELGPFVMNM